jgi:DNA-binding NtrC family response regulator
MGHRILVVDDDDAIRQTMTTILEGVGYEVALADSAEEARRYLATESADLVLVDAVLPQESGRSLAEHLATERGLPVVFVTGDPTMYFELKRAPFVRMGKPFRVLSLLQVVDQEIRAAERKRAPRRVEPRADHATA